MAVARKKRHKKDANVGTKEATNLCGVTNKKKDNIPDIARIAGRRRRGWKRETLLFNSVGAKKDCRN